MKQSPRVALVLGGGGIAGYSFHTASLGAIHEATGWDPRTAEVIIGTSAGSSIGSLIAGDVSVEDMLARVLSVPVDPGGMAKLRTISGRGLPVRLSRGVTGLGMSARELLRFPHINFLRLASGLIPQGSVDTTVVGEAALSLHGDGWPDRQLWITAVNTADGSRAVFGRDRGDAPVHLAVQASCAVPGLFQPVAIGNETFVDGGVHSVTNADLLLDDGVPRFDLVVIISPMSQRHAAPVHGVNSTLRVVPTRQLRREVAAIKATGTPVLVIDPDPAVISAVGANPMDPTRVVSVVVESSNSAFELLDRPKLAPQVDILRRAAEAYDPPADVAFPDPLAI